MFREQLINVYLDWRNNFISVAGFAEHYGLHMDEAQALIDLSKKVFEKNHPDA